MTPIPLDGRGTLYEQLYRGLREAILEGVWPPGSRLPATRRLASELGVSRNTVLSAYALLGSEGYAVGRIGSGTYVSSTLPEEYLLAAGARENGDAPRASAPPPPFAARPASGTLGERAGWPGWAALRRRPVRLLVRPARLRRLPARRMAPSPRRGQSGDVRHLARLRRSGRRGTAARGDRRLSGPGPGGRCDPDRVVVVNGSRQGLDLAARLLLDPDDSVVLEDPHFDEARRLLTAFGVRVRTVPVDYDGLRPERLPRGDRVRLAYVTPSHQFPSGGVLPLDRRLELLEWAEAEGVYIVEDDYDSEFRYEGRPVEAVQGLDRSGRGLYLGTFSKVMSPALRIGYIVLPESLVPAFPEAKWLADCHTPRLVQRALAAFLAGGHFERHLRRVRTRNAARRRVLLRALEARLGDRVEVAGSNAGVHLLLRVPGLPAAAGTAGWTTTTGSPPCWPGRRSACWPRPPASNLS